MYTVCVAFAEWYSRLCFSVRYDGMVVMTQALTRKMSWVSPGFPREESKIRVEISQAQVVTIQPLPLHKTTVGCEINSRHHPVKESSNAPFESKDSC